MALCAISLTSLILKQWGFSLNSMEFYGILWNSKELSTVSGSKLTGMLRRDTRSVHSGISSGGDQETGPHMMILTVLVSFVHGVGAADTFLANTGTSRVIAGRSRQ